MDLPERASSFSCSMSESLKGPNMYLSFSKSFSGLTRNSWERGIIQSLKIGKSPSVGQLSHCLTRLVNGPFGVSILLQKYFTPLSTSIHSLYFASGCSVPVRCIV